MDQKLCMMDYVGLMFWFKLQIRFIIFFWCDDKFDDEMCTKIINDPMINAFDWQREYTPTGHASILWELNILRFQHNCPWA